MHPNPRALVAALVVAACGTSDPQKISLPVPGAPTAPQPTAVETIVAAPAELAAPVRATGTSQPIRKADLAPAMTARIEQLLVREGQDVRAGQPLVVLDGRAAELTAEQARSAAVAGRAQADQLDADYQRLAPLAERGSIAASRLEQLDSQRTAARAQARAAQIAAAAAARVAEHAVLRAPFAGTIVDLPHEVGELASGGPLVRLVDLSGLEIHVRVAARDLGRLSRGDAVTARFPQAGATARGSIVTVGLEVEPTTDTAEVVAVIPNPDRALRAGLFAEIELQPARQRTAVVVPRTAIAAGSGQASVFAVVAGRAVRRAVEVAPFDDARVEIVKGLDTPAALVADRLDRLADGAAVTATPRPAQPTQTAEATP